MLIHNLHSTDEKKGLETGLKRVKFKKLSPYQHSKGKSKNDNNSTSSQNYLLTWANNLLDLLRSVSDFPRYTRILIFK